MTSTKTLQAGKSAPPRRLWFQQRGLWRSPDEGSPAPAPEPAPAAPTPGGNQGGSPTAGFTHEQQTQLNSLLGNTRKEAREAAQRQLLADLGIADLESLKAKVAAAQQKEDSEKTELQKLAEKVAKLEGKATETVQKASRVLVKARAEVLAAQHGFDPAKVSELLSAFGGLDGFKVDLETGAVEGLDAVFTTLKALVAPDPQPLDPLKPADPTPAQRSFVRQNPGGAAPKINPARAYLNQAYGRKPKA
jgi:hypothetical protein